jgi:hypothetical protein
MASADLCIGSRERTVTYCGHRIWGPYTNKQGKPVQPGGTITMREDFKTREGEPAHRLKELRIDSDYVAPLALAPVLDALDCGESLNVEIGTFEAGDKTWQSVIGVRRFSGDVDE